MRKQTKGFAEGKGPSDLQNSLNYNYRLAKFIEESYYDYEDKPEEIPYVIEDYFKDNLMRRFNMI